MPTRRIFEVVAVTVVLMHPVMSMVRLWAHRKLSTAQPGTLAYGTAEIVTVVA